MLQRILIGIGVLLSVFLLTAGTANALKIQPLLIDDLNVKPGSSSITKIKLTNDESASLKVKANFYDVEPGSDEGGSVLYSNRSQDSTLSNWINLNGLDEFVLEPGQSKEVKLIVSVPVGASPGGHYALLSWGAAGVAPGKNSVGVSGEVGTNIALNVPGNVTEKGDIISFGTIDKASKYERLPIEFSLRVGNSGNRHFKPKGVVSIQDMFGRSVTTLNVNDSSRNVLPKTIQEFKAQWNDGFAFGKYTAVASIAMGGAGSASANYEFWVLPTGLLVLWLVIAVVVVIILAMLIKNMMSSMKKQ
ncbi:hypothetical protein HY620_01750 [Candidatus Uhrbacteria bacterium]|nr:hypothetical protein [Candidatus Uhrbacteria bacterium]